MRRRTALMLVGAAGGLAACRPAVQVAASPPAEFAGPQLLADVFISFDATRLPLQVWAGENATGEPAEPWAVIVALHGMNDYAQAFGLAGPAWAAQGITTYAYDQRGFGRTSERGVWGGQGLMEEDLRIAVSLARARHPRAVLAVVGESMGGAVAISAFSSARPPAADRLVLAAPAVWGWGAQPVPNRVALWLAAHVAPTRTLAAPGWLARRIRASDNIEELRRMGRDRNMIFETRIDTVYGLVSLMQTARESVRGVRAPTLFLYGAHDQIIPKAAAIYAAQQLKPTDQSVYYAGGYHLLTRDLDRRLVCDDIVSFIRNPTAPPPSGAPSLTPPPATGEAAAPGA